MPRPPTILTVLLLALPPHAAPAADPDPTGWTEVARIFAERCVMCHSAQGAGRGLRLDSYDAILVGSERGPVVVPGDAGKSELIRRLRGDSLPRMPFLSRPLPPEELDVILRWVDAGFPGPSADRPDATAQASGD